MDLLKIITHNLKIESNVKLISTIDEIKYIKQWDKYIKLLGKYKPTNDIEKYLVDFTLKPETTTQLELGINYYNNPFSSIYFVLSNPFTIDNPVFNVLFKNRNMINQIPTLLKKCFSHPEYFNYYNEEIINRWLSVIQYKPILYKEYKKVSQKSEDKQILRFKKYKILWKIFIDNCNEFSKEIKKYAKKYKNNDNNKIVGCYHIGNTYYEHCLESHLGIKIHIPNGDSKHLGIKLDITKLLKWGHIELERLVKKMRVYAQKVDSTIKSDMDFTKILDKLKNNETQKYKSIKELEEYYKNVIKKYSDIYIKKLKFPEYEKPNLVIFSNSKLGGGYYTLNNFYLNTFNWKNMRKFTVESLVLHETIPGHHTQVHTMLNHGIKYPVLFYFPSLLNGFIEGWGLFSEQLGFNQTDWDIIGQIEYEMYRTLRIIVDISLHYHGKTPDEMFNFMKDYLLMDHESIKNEIYRYVCNPGQAVSYKVGSQVFKKIININNWDTINNKNYELCNKIILDGPLPLKFLIEKYKINIDNLFS
jgi:hypothetical protein